MWLPLIIDCRESILSLIHAKLLTEMWKIHQKIHLPTSACIWKLTERRAQTWDPDAKNTQYPQDRYLRHFIAVQCFTQWHVEVYQSCTSTSIQGQVWLPFKCLGCIPASAPKKCKFPVGLCHICQIQTHILQIQQGLNWS